MPIPSPPLATYRLQLSRTVDLVRARGLIPYLKELGISHVYLSPLLAARAGSSHGYDVVDHSRLNPEYGTEEDLGAFAAGLAQADMGIIADLVPNHMCIADAANARWYDVMEDGEASASTDFFDIDWGPPKAELAGKVLLPVLGEQFGRELERGAVKVVFERGTFSLSYAERRFPLTPPSWKVILEPIWRSVKARTGDDGPQAIELESILRSLGHWPAERTAARARRHERDAIARRLASLAEDASIQADVEAAVAAVNGKIGDAASFDRLEQLVSEQHYRLAHWRVAAHEINYRRFFDVNDLAAIRVENDDVFRTVHELPCRWAEQGWLSGFRIDHVDGLLEPARYLAQLRQRVADPAFYLIVEKILASGETLPEGWMTDGTTGYDHTAAVSAVLVDSDNAARLRELWRELAGQTQSFRDVVYESKRLILDTAMVAELTVLAKRLDALSEQHRYSRDFTFESLRDALREVIAVFPVYRTYITREASFVTERDARVIKVATDEAARRNPVINRSLFDFLEEVLLQREQEGMDAQQRQARRDFTLRFQQLTGPVTAKGVEDTAFYRFFPLASLDEVGGDPDRLGASVDELNVTNRLRAQATPRSLSASATHDTKRGEDTRARLHVLSELPDEWRAAVLRWRELNVAHRSRPANVDVPDPAADYFIYQSLVGGWPAAGWASDPTFPARFKAYIRKANAEAKLHTSWINPNEPYEQAVDQFIDAILDRDRSAAFLADVERFVATVELPGFLNSLTQLVLKVACPGVPDVYQGTELWDLSYADPDNRRPVDYEARTALLTRLRAETARDAARTATELLGELETGALKMFVLNQSLALRQARRASFESPRYEGCTIHGSRSRNVIAFSRGEVGRRVFVVAGRLFARLVGSGVAGALGTAWGDDGVQIAEPLPNARYREAVTNREIPVSRLNGGAGFALADLFHCLPVALVEEIA
ncbi:MAG TPA: malto-oligosyltrehalose synthase [Polyangia bacterium]